MTDTELCRALMSIGYRDYIASRVLINNNYILQGALLASTAVEKYLKAVLALHGFRTDIHMDNYKKFKKLFVRTPYNMMFDVLDPVFMELLAKAYRYRYLDEKTITKPDTIGFLVNQFLGTLDFTILKLDSLMIIQKESNEGVKTIMDSELKMAAKRGLPDLWVNNYVLHKIDKTEFMNRKSAAFGFSVTPLDFGAQFEVTGTDVVGLYEGKIWTVNLNMQPENPDN